MKAELGITGWCGNIWTLVEIIDETPKKYRIRALEETALAGPHRRLKRGQTVLVPKHAIRLLDTGTQP